VVVGKEYVYKLVITGKNDGRASFSPISPNPAYVYIDDSALVAPSIENIQYALVTAANGNAESLEVSWPFDNDNPNVTYKLYRARLGVNGVKNPVLVNPDLSNNISGNIDSSNIVDYASITWVSATGTVPSLSKANNPANFKRDSSGRELVFWNDASSNLTLRENYAYKVEATWTVDGTTVSAEPKVSIVNVAPYVTYSNLEINVRTQNIGSSADWNFPANGVHVDVYDNSEYIKDAPVDIYRQRVDASGSSDGTQFTKVHTIPAGDPLTWRDTTISGTAADQYYKYKAVIRTSLNKTTDNISANTVKPSDSPGFFISSSFVGTITAVPGGNPPLVNRSLTVTFTDISILASEPDTTPEGRRFEGVRLYVQFEGNNGTTVSRNGILTRTSGTNRYTTTVSYGSPGTQVPGGYTVGSNATPLYYGFFDGDLSATYDEPLLRYRVRRQATSLGITFGN
jgi:hypothetical protein